MATPRELEHCFQQLRGEAKLLAGGNQDLAQRAAVYHHLYQHSGGNHVFPLIAAHGALWAKGYFAFGLRIGRLASWQYMNTSVRRKKQEMLAAFADAFRNVNRLVCIETYTTYHFSLRHGEHPQAKAFIPAGLLEKLNQVHRAQRSGQVLTLAERRDMFETFFLNEQETVVGPNIELAVALFEWPLMRCLSLMPHVRFAYLPRGGLQFFNFANRSERIKLGLRSFDLAARVGFEQVERSLASYRVLPTSFFDNSLAHFQTMRQRVLAA